MQSRVIGLIRVPGTLLETPSSVSRNHVAFEIGGGGGEEERYIDCNIVVVYRGIGELWKGWWRGGGERNVAFAR